MAVVKSSTSSTKAADAARARQRRFAVELRTRVRTTQFTIALAGILLFLLVALFIPSVRTHTLTTLGLDWMLVRNANISVNCSLPKYREHRYCRPTARATRDSSLQELRRVRHGGGFSLSE